MASKREKEDAELPTVYVKTPYGAVVKVPRRRAEALLSRHPIEVPGGKVAGWSEASAADRDRHKDPIEDEETGGARLVRTEPTVSAPVETPGVKRG